MIDNMPNAFKKGAPRRPPQGLSVSEMRRIYLLLVITGFVVLVMFLLHRVILQAPQAGTGEAQGDLIPRRPPPAVPKARPPSEPAPTPLASASQEEEWNRALEEFRVPDPNEKIVKESNGFLTLLRHFVTVLTPEEASRRVDPALKVSHLFHKPDEHRGKFLRLTGRLIQLYTERIECTTQTGHDVVYLAIIEAHEMHQPSRTVWLYLPEKPRDPATGKEITFRTYLRNGVEFIDENVEVEGMFLRPYRYETHGDNPRVATFVTAAALLGKNLRLYTPPPAPDNRTAFIFFVAGIGTVLVAIIILGGFMYRKHSSGSIHLKLHELRRKKKSESTREKSEGPPSGGTPPPAETGPTSSPPSA